MNDAHPNAIVLSYIWGEHEPWEAKHFDIEPKKITDARMLLFKYYRELMELFRTGEIP